MAIMDVSPPTASTADPDIGVRITPLRGLRTDVPHRTRRRGLDGLIVSALQQGVLGYVGALAVTWLLAGFYFALPGRWTAGVVSLVAVWLLYSFAALPAYERGRSFKPTIRFIEVVGVTMFVFVITDVDSSTVLRQAIVAVLAAPALSVVSAVLHRKLVLRRTPTILVGQVAAVERLSVKWAARTDVNVVATCSWPAPNELAPAGAATDESLAPVIHEVLALVEAHGATSVVIASGRAFATPALRHLAWTLQRAEVECLVVADMSDHVEHLHPQRIGDQIALSLRSRNDHLMSRAAKSVFDRTVAALALIVLSPLLLVLALAIRAGSNGPAVFRQVRTGRDGEPFTIFKFRTMVADAEERLGALQDHNEGAGPLFKLRHDPRVTRFGAFLRKTSLDELPQLINVVKGEMSLVGPRPALESETSQYSEWVWRRLHVKPGITGLWQVSGRSSLSWEESIRMDLQYVNNWNLRLDFAVLVRTFRAVLTRDGAH